MPETYDAMRGRNILATQYDETSDELVLLFAGPDGTKFCVTFPRSIGPVICAGITAAAAKAPETKKAGEQEFQALMYEALQVALGPEGSPIISFVSKDGSRLNMTTSPSMPADLRALAKKLEELVARRS